MSKPYIRKRGTAETKNLDTFTCIKCGEKFTSKLDFKQHWRESADHDQRKIK